MLNRVRAALHPLRLVGLFFRSTHTSRLCAMSAGSVSASSGRVDAVGSANPTTRVIDTAADSTAAGPGRAGEEVGGGEGEKPQVQLPKGNNLVMQIILRRDLLTVHQWPIGPLLAQAAHAATAVMHIHRTHPDVVRYFEGDGGDGRGWEVMRKVTYEVADETSLRALAASLDKLGDKAPPYHLWVEQPENIPTALALVPNKRPKGVKKALEDAGCKLFG